MSILQMLRGYSFCLVLDVSFCYHCQEKKDKLEAAKASYDSWKDGKKNYVSDKTIKKRKEEQAVIEKENAQRTKKKDAELVMLLCFCFFVILHSILLALYF